MATYYVDPNAGGNDDGTDWTNAWTTLQRAIDGTNGTQPSAGDTVYCRNSGAGSGETLGAKVDVDGNSGDTTSGYIKYIGCNASGSVDGTRYVLDANSTAANCIDVTTPYIWFENFEFKNATGNGVNTSSAGDYNIFVNCSSNNNGAAGFDWSGAIYCQLVRCLSYDNTTAGFLDCSFGRFLLCASYGNGDDGFDMGFYDATLIIYCVCHDNGDNDEQIVADDGNLIINCVIDGTDQTGETGINVDEYNTVIANRFTNLATGLNIDDGIYGWNLFYNNTTDITNVVAETIPLDGTSDTNDTTDGDADDGYNATATDDFNLKASRTYNGDGNDVVDLNIGS